MSEREKLQRLQFEFAAHIRDPDNAPAPAGIEDRRMKIYRELFYNNLRDLLGRSFPVLKRILGEDAWSAMVRDWLRHHRAQTPLFLELPQEFLAYLQHERSAAAGDPPFMLELAHYEWVELALGIDEREIDDGALDPAGDLLKGCPVLSPLASSLAYTWPVHRISPDYQPAEPPAEPTRLLVYRDRRDEVGFIEINMVTARLLELLDVPPDARRSGRDCLLQIAAELGRPGPEAVISAGLEILSGLRERDVIIGVAPCPDPTGRETGQ
ncbi:DUF2063 domain-containing protein [Thioalkalivibrio sp. XN279]|uniref:HvfC family RiPP maturation protein n=1 Tax=Thioalkalivibrio sp. XN279 TaxID=2714953 RepID=UPI0014094A8B|nr:putative DNA-binding domain-containing protein [Thioalkalivibrio sp. XN279]NHA14833.1 DUF2063 domain-containing protein [Thioalkalivibrio sp. XN279]